MLSTITLLVTSLAISQLPAAAPPSQTEPAVREQPFGELLTPESQAKTSEEVVSGNAQTNKTVATPPEIVAWAMEPPEENALLGQGMSLAEALSYAATPQRQLEVTHAYWRLAAAVAGYNIQCRLVRLLDIPDAAPADLPLLKTAQESAAASIEEARCAAITAQHDLAEAAALPLGQNLPLPSDLPHVGTYHTHFSEIFAAKTAPPALRLIDGLLPIYGKAIDARGLAAASARESFDAALVDYRAGRAGLDGVIARAASLGRQQIALLISVCDYNHEIVEYAVGSLAQPVGGPALVAMLIKTQNAPGQFDAGGAMSTASRNQPTLAPPRDAVRRLNYDEPATDNPLQSVPQNSPSVQNPLRGKSNDVPAVNNPMRGEPNNQPASEEPSRFDPSGEPARRLTPIDSGDSSQSGAINNRPVVPVQAKPQSLSSPDSQTPSERPAPRSVGKPPLDAQGAHENVELPADAAARAVELPDYLEMGRGGDRQAMIEAFWLAQQRTSEYRTLARQARLLDEIRLACGTRPATARLQASRLATEAEMLDAHIRLLQSQYGLANLVGRASESTWLTAATSPRATAYDAVYYSSPGQSNAGQSVRGGFDATQPAAFDSWPLRRLRAAIPSLHETVRRRSAAAAEAEKSRAAALADLRKPDQGTAAAADRAIDCTTRQTEENLLLLASLSRYNNAVARHALTSLPATVSGRVLADVLLN